MGDTSWANRWDGLRGSIGPLEALGIAWWWFWWCNARRSDRNPERDGYVLLVGVLGGSSSSRTLRPSILLRTASASALRSTVWK